MIRNLFFLIACLFSVAGMASEYEEDADYSWSKNAPYRCIHSNTKIVESPKSACNKNGEAFKDFIVKFRSNRSFRNSRVINDKYLKAEFKLLGEWNNGNGYQLLKPVQYKQRCNKSYGSWFNISANEVCFTFDDVLPCDDGGSSIRARFQRIKDKWYLTALMLAG